MNITGFCSLLLFSWKQLVAKENKAWIPAVQRLCTALGTLLQVQAGQQRYPSRVPGGGNQLSALRALEVVQRAVIACLVTAQQQKLNMS